MSAEYKDFTVIHTWSGWQATVRIEQDESTREAMRDMLLMWTNNGPERLQDAEGDVTEAWLVMFGEYAFPESRGKKLKALKALFERTPGWAPLDGSCGIELIRAESFETDAIDFTIVPSTKANNKECASC
ncbi:DUF2528 family protein [Marinobacterium stanieri]|uniref:Uncharacterized protein n=1 Tax=Marinobacterium stanieri TaxID=49186 RepID=A0A1N6Q3Z0_9GAMM|nr:DUF2528 family protein [Marinobacterium stanieri]SIQ11394.1 Protein of unknown function [Marinobacterium stanieri]